jgi:subfamily B ATP-binding cassette protein MsbA
LKQAKTIRLLLSLIRDSRWALPTTVVLGIVSSLAESVGLSLFVPLLQNLDRAPAASSTENSLEKFFQFVLRHVPNSNPLPYIVALILAMTVVKATLTYGHSILSASLNAQVTHTLRSRIHSQLMGISQSALNSAGSGRLINLLATDTWHTSDAISLLIGMVINLCSILVFSALLITLSWKLTILVAAGVAVVSLVLRSVTFQARRLGQQGVEANAVQSQHMVETLDGIREIQMFSLRAYRERLFASASETVRSIYFRLDLLHRAVAPLSELLYVTLLLGLLFAAVGRYSTANIVVFLLVLYRLQPQIRQLDSARLSLVSLYSPVEEVVGFLESRLDPPHVIGERGPEFHGQIEFDAVSFSYESANDVAIERDVAIKNVSLRIPFGKTTAIVGRSGSGKTTLVSLLCRFYEPVLGQIHVDGRLLSSIDVDDWRGRIGWVSQDAYLFSGSIRENIRYGKLDASSEQIIEAAHAADADGFIRDLARGYDTIIGSSGTQLSSGQIQRIALARAFVRKPAILILDEATNALDGLSEDLIRTHLGSFGEGRTVIIISHRLSSVKHADRVIVLEDGRVSEQGTPSELLRRRGFLSTLREVQHVE